MEGLLNALKAAAEPTRLRLLVLCAHSDLTVSELTQILGQSQPRVSRHLKLLCEAALLDRRREGAWAYLRLARRGPQAELARGLVDGIPDEDPTVALDLKRLEALIRDRVARAEDYFRRNATEWDKIRSLYVDEREVEAALLELLPQDEVRDLIDIGTGTGRMIELFGPRIESGVGVDLSNEMLLLARAHIDQARLRNCVVRKGDMYQLPAANGSFDAAIFHHVLHFAERPDLAIAEAARVLRDDGRLVVVDFALHQLDELRSEHMHRWLGFHDDEIAEWCRTAGLVPAPSLHLPGDPLNVVIWCARRPAAGHALPIQGERRSQHEHAREGELRT